MSRLKFYMDEQVPNSVIKGLRLRGVDVLTTKEADLLGGTDKEHLVSHRVKEGSSLLILPVLHISWDE